MLKVLQIIPLQTILFIGFQFLFLIVGGLSINGTLKAVLMIASAIIVIIMALSFKRDYTKSWLGETWDFTKKILPYLFIGVFSAGIITAILPESIVQTLLGGERLISLHQFLEL